MMTEQWQRQRNAHLIFWNLERPAGWTGTVGEYGRLCRELLYTRYFDEVWLSDRELARETELRFVVLGSHPGLGVPGNAKVYDFVHMSYITPRRQSVYKLFTDDVIAPNCWGEKRDLILKQSRFALNIHKDNHPFQEPLRLALFAAYGLPILTETILDSYPWSEEFCVYNPYDGIDGRLKQMLDEDYSRWQEMGLRARERMCVDFEFGKVVRQAVKESTRW
jgi:hypothetical protein